MNTVRQCITSDQETRLYLESEIRAEHNFEQGDTRENAKQLLESALEATKQPVQVFSPPG